MKKHYFTNEVSDKLKSVKDLPDFVINYPKFAEQIKIIRESLGLTQKQLAYKINSTARSIIRIEQGKMLPNVATLEKIAEVLNAKLNILFVPQKEINELLNEKAEQKAKQLVGLARGNSALEEQSPSDQAYRREIEKTKKELLDKKRGLLWDN
jgi:transcriptional regulator with XRE-family HTH domain